MDKSYQPRDIEQRTYERWEENGYFAPQGDGEPYCIMIPPPNVTGTLHMGHGFGDTIQDALTRYYRMCGRKALWQPGSREICRARLAMEGGIRRQDCEANSAPRRVGRLEPRPFHNGRGLLGSRPQSIYLVI